MEKLITGAAVFAAILCGQPDLLAVLCLYLFVAIVLTTLAVAAISPPARGQR